MASLENFTPDNKPWTTCDLCGRGLLIHLAEKLWRNRIPVKRQDSRLGEYMYCTQCASKIQYEKEQEVFNN
jgi:hypothetical protein